MKRKIRNIIKGVIIFFQVLLLLVLFCTGCSRGEEAETDRIPGIEALPGTGEETEAAGESDAGMPTAREEKDYPTLEEELRPSILQIYCGDYRGSGVIWKITEKEVTVISSAHLLRNADTCEVLCYAGIYYKAQVDRILEDCDVGFAVFSAEALKEDGVELAAVEPSTREKEEIVPGEDLAIYGSMDYAAGDFVKGYLIEAETAMQLEGNEEEQLLMLGGIVREDGEAAEQGAVDAGMSGSGVFDKSGKLLGILAGGDGESGFAAVPVWQIETE